jgi:hypothetical protein
MDSIKNQNEELMIFAASLHEISKLALDPLCIRDDKTGSSSWSDQGEELTTEIIPLPGAPWRGFR